MRSRSKNNSFVENSFYCINCGNKGIPVLRNRGFQRESFHRKKLYCLYCGQETNHIECKTFEEIEIFKEEFARGRYEIEAANSLAHCASL